MPIKKFYSEDDSVIIITQNGEDKSLITVDGNGSVSISGQLLTAEMNTPRTQIDVKQRVPNLTTEETRCHLKWTKDIHGGYSSSFFDYHLSHDAETFTITRDYETLISTDGGLSPRLSCERALYDLIRRDA